MYILGYVSADTVPMSPDQPEANIRLLKHETGVNLLLIRSFDKRRNELFKAYAKCVWYSISRDKSRRKIHVCVNVTKIWTRGDADSEEIRRS